MNATTRYIYPKNSTIKNTDKWYYNCGGYALSTFRWVYPAQDEASWEQLQQIYDTEGAEYATLVAVDWLIQEFNLELVSAISVYNRAINYRKYEVIAFRYEDTDEDGDFHFMKLGRDGRWRDKRGSSSYINVHSYDYVFESWYDRYDGPIAFMIRPR